MTNYRQLLITFGYTVLALTSNAASAQTATTTHLRCFYQETPSNLTPMTSWIWAVDPVKIDKNRFSKANFDALYPTKPGLNVIDPKLNANLQGHPYSPYTDLSKNDPAKKVSLSATASDQRFLVQGYWYSKPFILANLFYSETSQATLYDTCKFSLALQGINEPVAMVAAAWDYFSYNYMIWSIDSQNQGTKINKIVSFGDSVSDTQNMFNGTYWVLPTQYNYYIGRFSNGKNWLDYLSADSNLPLYNWAIGGAASQSEYFNSIRGVTDQVESWIEYMDRDYAKNYQPENTLFTLLIGANDLISYGLNGDQIFNNVSEAVNNLITKGGAKNILLVNLPDIALAPLFKLSPQNSRKEYVQSQIIDYNDKLPGLVTYLRAEHSDLNIQLFDGWGLVNDMINNGSKYNITNTTDSCLLLNSDSVLNYTGRDERRPECISAPNQGDSYLFWDLLHPTTHTHKILADKAFCFIRNKFDASLNPVTNPTLPLCEIGQ